MRRLERGAGRRRGREQVPSPAAGARQFRASCWCGARGRGSHPRTRAAVGLRPEVLWAPARGWLTIGGHTRAIDESAARRRKENAAAERREARRPAYRPAISGDPEIGPTARRAIGCGVPHQRLSALCSPHFLREQKTDEGAPGAPLEPDGGALTDRSCLNRSAKIGRTGEARMAFDTIIRGGTVATAADTFACDVGITDGRIVALGADLGNAAEIVDASGKLVLPGGIDSHVHLAQPSGPGIVMADDFESGTRAAAFGGNTMVLPFAMQQKGESLREVVKQYHVKAEGNCYVDVSFHLIIADATDRVLGQELPALVEDGYTSFKVFMTYEGMALTDMELLNVMSVARETGALVMVHAENYDAIRFLTDRLERAGHTAPKFHATSRPIPVEREATHRAISLAELVDVPIMIVHVSNGEAMEEISRAQRRGLKIYGETCPQYLVLTAKDMEGLTWRARNTAALRRRAPRRV